MKISYQIVALCALAFAVCSSAATLAEHSEIVPVKQPPPKAATSSPFCAPTMQKLNFLEVSQSSACIAWRYGDNWPPLFVHFQCIGSDSSKYGDRNYCKTDATSEASCADWNNHLGKSMEACFPVIKSMFQRLDPSVLSTQSEMWYVREFHNGTLPICRTAADLGCLDLDAKVESAVNPHPVIHLFEWIASRIVIVIPDIAARTKLQQMLRDSAMHFAKTMEKLTYSPSTAEPNSDECPNARALEEELRKHIPALLEKLGRKVVADVKAGVQKGVQAVEKVGKQIGTDVQNHVQAAKKWLHLGRKARAGPSSLDSTALPSKSKFRQFRHAPQARELQPEQSEAN